MTASMHKCTIVLSYNYIVHELFFITNRKHGENEDFHSSLVNGFLLTCALRIRSSILFLEKVFLEKVLLGIEKVLIIFLIFDKFFLKTNLLMYILREYINRTHSKLILLRVIVLRAFTLKLSKAKNVIF